MEWRRTDGEEMDKERFVTRNFGRTLVVKDTMVGLEPSRPLGRFSGERGRLRRWLLCYSKISWVWTRR